MCIDTNTVGKKVYTPLLKLQAPSKRLFNIVLVQGCVYLCKEAVVNYLSPPE